MSYNFKNHISQLQVPVEVTDINGNILAVFHDKNRLVDFVNTEYKDRDAFICERFEDQYQLYALMNDAESLFQV